MRRRHYLKILTGAATLAGCASPTQQTPTTPTRTFQETDIERTVTGEQQPIEPPSATFFFTPETPSVGDPVSFNAEESTDPDGEIIEYRWDFNGDETVDDITQTPTTTHSYNEPGTYLVILEVEDDDGATDRHRDQVMVAANPVAECSVSATDVQPGDQITIDASESNAELVRFDTNGDGEFDRTNQADFIETVQYAASGTYTPIVQAVIGDETDTHECATISVNQPPQAVIDAPADAQRVDTTVELDARRSVDTDGEIVQYRWDFDGDNNFDTVQSGPTATTSYEAPGTYQITLEVEDDDGAIGRTQTTVRIVEPPPLDIVVAAIGGLVGTGVLREAYRRVTDDPDDVPNHPPVANIVFTPREPAPYRPLVFDGTLSTDPDPEDDITSYHWNLPNHESSAARFVHSFPAPGEQTIELTVTDEHGTVGTLEKTITVKEAAGQLELDRVHPDAPGDDHEQLDQEYLVFRNTGDDAIDLGAWTVHDAAQEEGRVRPGEHTFEFPDSYELPPDATVTVHTGAKPDTATEYEESADSRHLFWGARRAIWNNDADVIVVEDADGYPVLACRYERTDVGNFEIEDLDEDSLLDWFETAVELAPSQGIVGRIVAELQSRLAAIRGAIRFVMGAVMLRGPDTFLKIWGVITLFLLLSTLTWWVSTSSGVVARSIEPVVPLLLLGSGVVLLVVGGVIAVLWRGVSFLWAALTGNP